MNTHESYVSLETARLLKEAGFDWECSHWYSLDGSQWLTDRETNNLSPENKKRFIHCPSLAVCQRWLRESKGIAVNVYSCLIPETGYKWYLRCVDMKQRDVWYKYMYKSYEEALETGIKKVLEIILDEGE